MLMTKSISRCFFALGLAAATSVALASEKPGRSLDPVVTVYFADLNTATSEGSRILYGRIENAVHAVCNAGAEWYPSQHWAELDCYRSTLDRVVAKLNLPVLTALHVSLTREKWRTFQANNR